MTDPFAYPSQPHQRRHGPQGYTDPVSFRPWLRDEFSFRCVYCLLREQWGRVRGIFDVEHFEPTSLHPDKATEYDNLLYACTTCNSAKRDRTLPDPLLVLTNAVVRVQEDGTLQVDSPEAARLIELLGLDSADANEFRALWIGIVALAERHEPTLLSRLMGYPNDLPDLTRLRPPKGNTRPEGIQESCHAQHSNQSLPHVY